MQTLFKTNRPFFIALFIWFVVVGGLIIWQTDNLLFLYINKHSSSEADFFFIWLTGLGTGLFSTLVALGLCFVRLRLGLLAGLSFALTGMFAQLLKRIFDLPRPRAYFQAIHEPIRLIENLEIHNAHSFPSGHSATAFAICAFLAFIIPNKRLGIFLVFLAALISFSRVYLSQHFPQDTLAGGVLGVAVSVGVYLVFGKSKSKLGWLDLPVHKIGKR